MPLINRGLSMNRAIPTLQLPREVHGIPVAATVDSGALRSFKHAVQEEWEAKLETSGDEFEAAVSGFEFERLRHLLELLIPRGLRGGQ
jgi:hypothetical protein